jgi:hypothetical protein
MASVPANERCPDAALALVGFGFVPNAEAEFWRRLAARRLARTGRALAVESTDLIRLAVMRAEVSRRLSA